jgi:hypothetical protein
LNIDDIIIPEVCPVLGIPLKVNTSRVSSGSPSLDRKDNNKGYTKDNTYVISYRANSLKNDATIEELEKVINYMRST